MIDILIFIHALFAVFAILFGLCSRNLSTSVVTGLVIGLIHAGIVALYGAKSGTMPVSDLSVVKDLLDAAMNTGYVTFKNARYVVYLAGSALALMALTIACFFMRWIVCRTICSLMPKRGAAAQG